MSKLGFHVAGPADWDRISEARPPLLVARDEYAALQHAHAALGDRCLLVTGTSALGSEWGAFWRGPAAQRLDRALDLWWQAAAPGLEAAPFACWLSFSGLHDAALAASFAAFEAARVERLAELGVRACVGNFATGTPRPGDPAWADWLTTCRAAQTHGGVLGLEEFGALYLWSGYGSNEWVGGGFRTERKFPAEHTRRASLALHARALIHEWLEPVGLGRLPVVITACGLGRSPLGDRITAALSADGQPTGGWQSCAPTWRQRDGEQDAADFYRRQLQWYDAQLARDESILGAAVYGWGTRDPHDIAGPVAAGLLRHISAGARPTAARPPQVDDPLPARSAPAARTWSAGPAAGERWYFVRAAHPEIFDRLWQQAEADADAARARLTWREIGGAFVIYVDDFGVWSDLYQYGQMLAQLQGATLDGGELDAPPQGWGGGIPG
ncbi:MAG: hypothetical protein JW910_12680 [Anaerolineae bacterium]|nr:hypothetical protein [Anaerolineae bacterium]